MATINNSLYTQAYENTYSYEKSREKKNVTSNEASQETSAANKAEETYGKDKVEVKGAGTYGNPKLSQTALDYYNSLKKKYGNLNFVLVASDKKQEAEMMKGSFASPNGLTVLIDTDKIERMATDEAYRKKYEAILSNATSGLSQMKTQLGSMANNVKAYGMSVNDNGMGSFFAVIDKSLAAQKERIEKKAQEKVQEKKNAAKKAEKKKAEERLEEKRKSAKEIDEETVTITANSVDELLRKIDQYYQQDMFNNLRTEEERAVGSRLDFSI